MKNSKLPLMIILVCLLGFTVYYFVMNHEKPFDAEEANFAVKDTNAIDMFFIADREGRNFKVEKKGENNWVINDEYKASNFMVNHVFLGTLAKLEVKSSVPKAMRNSVITNLATKGIKVELYSNKKKFKTFYVGGTTSDDLGTYFIMEGSENPFIMHIRGFNGFLTSRFQITKDTWIDKIYFDYNKNEIENIKVSYATDSLQSFEIIKNNGIFEVVDLENLDSAKVKQYLSYYLKSNLENILEGRNELKDSLLNTKPYCKIELKSTNTERNKSISLYPFNSIDRMYAITENGTLSTVQYFMFQNLMVSRTFFEKRKSIL